MCPNALEGVLTYRLFPSQDLPFRRLEQNVANKSVYGANTKSDYSTHASIKNVD